MRRARDLIDMMKPVTADGRERHLIHPSEDERVLRVVRKIIQGLSHHFGIESAVSESRIWVDILRYQVPDGLVDDCALEHRYPGVYECHGEVLGIEEFEVSSAWLFLFYERTPIVGIVSKREDGSQGR